MMSSEATTSKQARRQRISDVATVMFWQYGFDNVSIAQIAESAGVAKMTVTNHFPLKEDMVFDEFPRELDDLTATLTGTTSIAEAVDALERLCERRELDSPLARSLASTQVPAGWQQFAGLILNSKALTSRFHSHYRDIHAAIERHLVTSNQAGTDAAAWFMAETLHLVDWWPVAAVDRGLSIPTIRTKRVEIRKQAFAALRVGVVAFDSD